MDTGDKGKGSSRNRAVSSSRGGWRERGGQWGPELDPDNYDYPDAHPDSRRQ